VLHQFGFPGDDYWVAPVDGGPHHRLELFDEGVPHTPRAITVDGRLIAVDARGPDLTVFDLLNGDIVMQLDGSSWGFGAVQLTADGNLVAVEYVDRADDSRHLAVYDIAVDDPISVIEDVEFGQYRMSPDGTYLVTTEPGPTSATSTVVVATVFGDEVFRRPDSILVGWAGDGTLLIDDVVPLGDRLGPGTIVSPGAVDWVRSLLPVFGAPDELIVPRSGRAGGTEVRRLVFVDHW